MPAQMRDVVLLVLDECHHAIKKRVAARTCTFRAACATRLHDETLFS
jgi:hypothetical protein